MTLARIMAAHGKALGPLGVAVYAWIEANPGSTFKEVADGLGMGESTVKRCVRQFEELEIASRRIETTPKGLALPTRIYPGTIERGTSDNPVTTETPLPQNPVTIEPPETIEVSLSDPGTIERGTSGTPIAPYSAIRTSTDTPQPSVDGADAPPSPRPSRKVLPHPSAKPESDHQRLMRELAKRLGGIADGAKQGKWAKWLLDHGYSVAECVECLDDLTAQDWRDTRVDWLEVSKQIGAWKARKESENSREVAPPTRNAIARGGFGRPNVSARTERQDRGAEALIVGAADRLARAGRVRGGGEPPNS